MKYIFGVNICSKTELIIAIQILENVPIFVPNVDKYSFQFFCVKYFEIFKIYYSIITETYFICRNSKQRTEKNRVASCNRFEFQNLKTVPRF